MACSNQRLHPRSLIGVFVVRKKIDKQEKKKYMHTYTHKKKLVFLAIRNAHSKNLIRLSKAQADLKFRQANMSEGTFSDIAAHIESYGNFPVSRCLTILEHTVYIFQAHGALDSIYNICVKDISTEQLGQVCKCFNFCLIEYWCAIEVGLTDVNAFLRKELLPFTTLLANSADRQISDSFFIFSRTQDFTFHAHCLHWKQFAWNVKSCVPRKIRKIFQYVVCWKLYPECVIPRKLDNSKQSPLFSEFWYFVFLQ